MNRRALDILPESFVMCLGDLFAAFSGRLDRPTGLMYWRALHDIPTPLLEAATGIAIRERVYASPPRPAEVRQFAERARMEILACHPWTSCGVCSAAGWILRDEDRRMERCGCVRKHHALLHQLGADGPALTKTAKRPDTEPVDLKSLASGE